MSINIYKNGSAYSPTPIINNGSNIYEPLIYTKDKMYSPANLTGNDLIFSYKNTRTTYTNPYWGNGGGIYNYKYYTEHFNCCISSYCCCHPWRYGEGLFFTKYQNNFSNNVGVFSGNISKMNVNYYDVYLDGSSQAGQIFWPVHKLSNYPNRTLHTNALVTVPKYFFQKNKITKTLTYSTASPKRFGYYYYASIAVTADFIPPAYRIGIGYKGGNTVSANSDTSKAGRIDMYSTHLSSAYTGKKANNETCRCFSPNLGLSAITGTVGTTTTAVGTYGGCSNKYLGKITSNNYQYLFKVNNTLYLSSWGTTIDDWYKGGGKVTNTTAYVSAISPPVIGLKPGPLSDSNTWRVSGTLSGYRRPAGGGSYSNYTSTIDLTLSNINTRNLCSDILYNYVWNNNSDYYIVIDDCNYGF